MLIGLPGSGKSTFYFDKFANTHLRINLDMLKTRRREKMIFDACLHSGQRMVIDNTNPSIEDRARYLTGAKENHFKSTAYYFDVPFQTCCERNQLRAGKAKVPEQGIKAVASKLEPPAIVEGFSVIYFVNEYFDVKIVNEIENEV